LTENKHIEEDEIDLVDLAKTIWAGRRFIAKVTGVFMLLGLLIAFTSKVEYEASCKLLPESQEGMSPDLGGLGGLAGLAGINLDLGGSGVLTPELYPEIVNSLPFQLKILNDSIYFEKLGIKTTALHYFEEIDNPSLFGYIAKYTIGLPGLIKKAIVGTEEKREQQTGEFIRLSKEEWKLIEKFKDRISVDIDTKSGIISVSIEMPDPMAAAELTDKIVKLLTKEITAYKIEKVRNNLTFVQSSFDDAKSEFEKAQTRLARSTDRNRNVSSAIAEIEIKRLENEYNVAFEIYKGLASQVEQAKIKLKEETPVFTVLEPVRVPEDKSRPRRGLILILFTVIGFFFGIAIYFISTYIKAMGGFYTQFED